ncbi:hypothetical protein SynBIOSE41_03797 [Synechococcus sp. BIOS-E4-1]|nr:hypothetical protein SynBIOSE41_03797 [Synechococcus sp. BIOS-E4-1]
MMDQLQQLPDCQITRLLKPHPISTGKTVADVASRFGIDYCELLVFLAQQILTLNDKQLAVMASGKKGGAPL